ncbi:MAG: hypothetical protein ACTS7E_02080 [Arsenophonus sp. NC-CH8-MAG3]
MLNNLTLRESAKETGIDLKTVFKWRHSFLASVAIVNLSALSGIVEVDKIFF